MDVTFMLNVFCAELAQLKGVSLLVFCWHGQCSQVLVTLGFPLFFWKVWKFIKSWVIQKW